MKIGDIVMFVDEGKYSKWFWGKLAEVLIANEGHCQVRWLQKVRYHDLHPTVSNFKISCFKVLK